MSEMRDDLPGTGRDEEPELSYDTAVEVPPPVVMDKSPFDDEDLYDFRVMPQRADNPPSMVPVSEEEAEADEFEEDLIPKDSSAPGSASSSTSETPTTSGSSEHPISPAPVERVSGSDKVGASGTPTS